MNWILFRFESGSNPYIAKTEKEAKKIFWKYKGKIEKIKKDIYFIYDLEPKSDFFPF